MLVSVALTQCTETETVSSVAVWSDSDDESMTAEARGDAKPRECRTRSSVSGSGRLWEVVPSVPWWPYRSVVRLWGGEGVFLGSDGTWGAGGTAGQSACSVESVGVVTALRSGGQREEWHCIIRVNDPGASP